MIYAESSLTYVSKFEGIPVNFNDFCVKSVLRFCAALVCGFAVF